MAYGVLSTSAMQMNYDIPVFRPGPISIPVVEKEPRESRPSSTSFATQPNRALARAHLEVARTEARENLVWMALALGGLGVLIVSFWI